MLVAAAGGAEIQVQPGVLRIGDRCRLVPELRIQAAGGEAGVSGSEAQRRGGRQRHLAEAVAVDGTIQLERQRAALRLLDDGEAAEGGVETGPDPRVVAGDGPAQRGATLQPSLRSVERTSIASARTSVSLSTTTLPEPSLRN